MTRTGALRSVVALACAASVAASQPANAETTPGADKFIALVRSDSCDWEKLQVKMAKVATAMVRQRQTTRVVIDWPADPDRNLDMMGRVSPILVALEVSAGQNGLGKLARKAERKLDRVCPTDVYLVRERRLLAAPRIWALGEASPEPKVLTTLIRKQGVEYPAFEAEWTGPHARMSLAWRAARGGGGHYVQNLVVSQAGKGALPIDGIGEIEAAGSRQVSDEERAARIETAKHALTFQDMEKAVLFTAKEVILKD